MCGFFGYIGPRPAASDKLVSTVSRLLHHRGPDDHAFEAGPGWGLGFQRLSILDVSELGRQPMSTQDGRFLVVFNGEIYNYLELRKDMEQKGEIFQSSSDTEVLLRLLASEGPQALEKLNGMFALALLDIQARTFLLARDRLGQKPLYFLPGGGQMRFASELKALLAWPNAPREIDPMALTQYLAFEYLPHSRSIFKGYRKLAPGSYLVGKMDDPDSFRQKSYWQLELNGEEGRSALTPAQMENLENLLTDATRIRLRSDVPVGVFLSGGIDSGIVASLTAQSAAGKDVRALTVGFTEKEYDETELARATARHVGLEQRITPQSSGGLATVDRLSWYFDEPFGDPSAIPTFHLCEAAAKYATVFLTGDGGDEAFGGYLKYTRSLQYRITHTLSQSFGPTIEEMSKSLPLFSSLRYRVARKSLPVGGFAAACGRAPIDPVLQLVLPPHIRPLAQKAGQPFWDRWQTYQGASMTARWQDLDFALYLPDDILVKVDRASMAHSIELRSPFLDFRVVEWAAGLPRATLLNMKGRKLPLRALAASHLPDAVRTGSKRGFGAPLDTWFRQPQGLSIAQERLLSRTARERGLWDLTGVERVIAAHQTKGGRDLGNWLWRLLILDAWARQYLDSNDFLQGPPTK